MGEGLRRRRLEWRAAGKRKADRMAWFIAIFAVLIVIGATLVAGHLRREAPPSFHGNPAASGGGDDGG